MQYISNCYTCELLVQRDENNSPLWDNIVRTEYWDIVHSYPTALPGWLVLVVRRHITAVEELTDEEAKELGVLIRRVSIILKQITACEKTYVVQFAESPKHPHVHFHIIPRMANQPENRRSVDVFNYLGVSEAERVKDSVMNKIAEQVRKLFNTMF
ncbi:MAG: HIT family protein [Promethearchaeota archaeon]